MIRIMVIDDDDEIRNMVKELLVRVGYQVIEASNGEIGMRLYRNQPADLIITDIFMPEKEGLETIMELRKDFPDVKIIAMSGGVAAMNATTTLYLAGKLGAERTIAKPITRAELLDSVREVLNEG